MEEKITIEDMRRAMDCIKEESMPLTKTITQFGWVETDAIGNPINIGLNEKSRKAVNNMMVDLDRFSECKKVNRGEVTEIFGIPIVIDEDMPNNKFKLVRR